MKSSSAGPVVTNTLIYGIMWILFNNLVMSVQTSTIKILVISFHKAQLIFIYKFIVFLCVLPWVFYQGIGVLKTKKIHLHLIRAALSFTGAMLYIHSLKQLNISQAMAIVFTEPLFINILAIVFLKEKYSVNILISLFIGFIGVIIVTRPGTNAFSSGAIWALAASIVWAFDNLVIKQLGKTENSTQYVFYVALFSIIFAAPFAFENWKTLPPEININLAKISIKSIDTNIILFTLAVYYFAHLLAVFRAYRYANLSTLIPFDFSRLIFTITLEYFIFAKEIDRWIIAGSVIIIASSAQIIWNKEHIKNKYNSINI